MKKRMLLLDALLFDALSSFQELFTGLQFHNHFVSSGDDMHRPIQNTWNAIQIFNGSGLRIFNKSFIINLHSVSSIYLKKR